MKRSVRMSKRRGNASTIGICGNGKKGSSGPDSLFVNLSMSSSISSKSLKGHQAKSEKSRPAPTKPTKRVQLIAEASLPRSGTVTSGIPEDVAVHFGNFYGHVALSTKEEGNREPRTTKSAFPASETTRSEFTRQMVHELERLAGTEDYARQVSALLDSTVESPNFYLKPPPADNFLPFLNSGSSDYPLWYKAPDKMLSSTDVDSTGNQIRQSNDENTLMNPLHNIRVENNDESSSGSSSELTSISDADAKEFSDYDEATVSIIAE